MQTLHVELRQDRLPDRVGSGPRQFVQLRLKRLGGDRLVLLGDPAPDGQVQFGPADLLREQVADPQLILAERLRLHLRADHLDELAQLPAVPNSFELGPRELDRHLDAPLPASLLDVEHAPHNAGAVRRFFRPEEERDAKLFAHWQRRVLANRHGVKPVGAVREPLLLGPGYPLRYTPLLWEIRKASIASPLSSRPSGKPALTAGCSTTFAAATPWPPAS